MKTKLNLNMLENLILKNNLTRITIKGIKNENKNEEHNGIKTN